MVIDPELIPLLSKKGSKAGRYFLKSAIYGSAGIAFVILVGLIETLFSFIGVAFLFALIWSQ